MVIGITGNTGSGKTLIAGFFEEWGGFVISVDRFGWEVLENSNIKERLKEAFGDRIIRGERVDRKSLGEIVFKDKEKLQQLNKIVHPVLLKMLKEVIDKSDKDIITVDAALIFEWGIEDWFDYIVLIDSKPSIIGSRLKRLGVSEEIIKGRIKSQMDLKKARKKADFIIENNGSVEDVRKEARNVWERMVGKNR